MKEKKVKAMHSIFGLEEDKIYKVEDENINSYLIDFGYTKVYLSKKIFKEEEEKEAI